MASSSSSHPGNEEPDAFSGIEPHGTRRKIDESSRLFNVFINHRGPDVKQTLALWFYNFLRELGIHAFLDSEEKELGNSFPSTIETAIHSAAVHIAIFSKGYAESPWCLAELVLMLQSRAKIIPLFYEVKASDLRFVEKGEYGKAFTRYEEKGRYMEKLEEWKEALQSVSFLTGHEISTDFNNSDCRNIVSAVQKEFQRKKSLHVAKYPVGLHRLVEDFERLCLYQLVEDFERQCLTNEGGKEKAQIVGLFGMGGVGKTTLAKELFNRTRSQYSQACFLFDVREAYSNKSFHSLQMKFLNDIFQNSRLKFQSTEEGKTHIADCIEMSNQLSFLIVVDDIDHVQQLDALLIMEMLNKSVNSLVIVTTRDVGVLINTGITVAYNLKGMDEHYARELFCWHAFGQPHPVKHFEDLVDSFLDVCGGLPLSLQVLGSHVHSRDQNYWSSELKKVSKTLPRDIHQRLKISFDALDYEEQQIFMDLACFFVDEDRSTAMEVWEASGWNAQHGLETLENKCLVQEIETNILEVKVRLRMHDHLRDLGREIANGMSRNRRLWRPKDLKNLESKGFRNILAQTRGRCFHSFFDKFMNCQITFLLGESDVSADTSTILLSLEIGEFQSRFFKPCIPSWVPLPNLRRLIIRNSPMKTFWSILVQPSIPSTSRIPPQNLGCSMIRIPKTLWKSQAPNQLKELTELNISECQDLKELTVVHMSCLQKIVLSNCSRLKIVSGIFDLRTLVELNIFGCPVIGQLRLVGVNNLKRITVDGSFKPTCFELDDCRNLKTISGILNLEKLLCLSINIHDCPMLEVFPYLVGPSNLETVTINGCGKLEMLFLSDCQNLKRVTGRFDMVRLSIMDCPELEALSLEGVTCPEKISIISCGKLLNINLPSKFWELPIVKKKKLELRMAKFGDLNTVPFAVPFALWKEMSSNARSSSSKMQLLYCTNVAIQKCVSMWKNVRPDVLLVVGKALNGALSNLNPDLFSDTNGLISEIGVPKRPERMGDSIVIYCGVVDELVVTVVTTDPYYGASYYNIIPQIRDYDVRHRVIKKLYKVVVKKGEELKIQQVLHSIIDRLYE